ncbi:MAG: LysR substrate-binding domain-containing protein, partial [Thermomonas sp.]
REGKLDAALLALPVHDEQLHTEFLFEEPFVLAAPAQHPLASQKSLSMDDLNDQTLLLLEDGHCLRDQALDVCRLSGANEKGGFRATSLETLRQMVAAGIGVTLLPALSVHEPVVQPANIRLVNFRDPVPSRQIALAWRRSSALDGFLHAFAEALGALARAKLPTA